MIYWLIAVIIVGLTVYKFFLSAKKGKPEILKKDWKKDVVYLYQFPRAKVLPNLSPFCLKIETFLKANKVPYEVSPVLISRSQYGKLPFVELNGEHIADSQVIINRLTKHFNLKQLSNPRDHAIARAVERMTEIHTFMVQYYFKIVDDANSLAEIGCRDANFPEWLIPVIVPIMGFFIKRKALQRIVSGVGGMSTENYKEVLKKDYDVYQALLGKQNYLFGDEIAAIDCSVFGQLATVLYLPYSCYAKDLLKEEYPALVDYCDRIKETVFGDYKPE
ncbi:unnamed protein product [Cylicocyclus nassatus]|uniref:Glutathione S-transferase n=1 Tax=Cylicocyclus nassatus TaxID=53992 RepID=A0AA36GTX6_CYLNA|nr:unnamed protein product [Cylicocyclus nassatus]